MTKEGRKKLTEYLEERWSSELPWVHCINRTFDTWDDLGDLKEKLVEKGDYGEAESFAWAKYNHVVSEIPTSFSCWFFTPFRFCQLVLKAIEKGVIKSED